MGRLQLLPDQYYDLTPAEVSYLIEGKNEQEETESWHFRAMTSYLLNVHTTKPIKPEELWKLSMDRQSEKQGQGEAFVQFIQLASAMGGQLIQEHE